MRALVASLLATVLPLTAGIPAHAAGEPPQVSTAAEAEALGGLLPDIIEEIPKHLAIHSAHKRDLLRFSTTHWNFGDGPLQVRGGGQVAPCVIDGTYEPQCTHATQEILDASGAIVATHPAGVAFFHAAHNHWHQSAVATFAVRASLDGPALGDLRIKTTFCLVDVDTSPMIHRNSTRVYWDCNGSLQGISVGWGDQYHHSTEGQELDVTDLPDGDYYLTQDANPDGNWLETDTGNNRSWAKFRLSRRGGTTKVTVLQTDGYAGNTSNK